MAKSPWVDGKGPDLSESLQGTLNTKRVAATVTIGTNKPEPISPGLAQGSGGNFDPNARGDVGEGILEETPVEEAEVVTDYVRQALVFAARQVSALTKTTYETLSDDVYLANSLLYRSVTGSSPGDTRISAVYTATESALSSIANSVLTGSFSDDVGPAARDSIVDTIVSGLDAALTTRFNQLLNTASVQFYNDAVLLLYEDPVDGGALSSARQLSKSAVSSCAEDRVDSIVAFFPPQSDTKKDSALAFAVQASKDAVTTISTEIAAPISLELSETILDMRDDIECFDQINSEIFPLIVPACRAYAESTVQATLEQFTHDVIAIVER